MVKAVIRERSLDLRLTLPTEVVGREAEAYPARLAGPLMEVDSFKLGVDFGLTSGAQQIGGKLHLSLEDLPVSDLRGKGGQGLKGFLHRNIGVAGSLLLAGGAGAAAFFGLGKEGSAHILSILPVMTFLAGYFLSAVGGDEAVKINPGHRPIIERLRRKFLETKPTQQEKEKWESALSQLLLADEDDDYDVETERNILAGLEKDPRLVFEIAQMITDPPFGLATPASLVEAVQYLGEAGLKLLEVAEQRLTVKAREVYFRRLPGKDRMGELVRGVVPGKLAGLFIDWLTNAQLTGYENLQVFRSISVSIFPPYELLKIAYKVFNKTPELPPVLNLPLRKIVVLASVTTHLALFSEQIERLFILSPEEIADYIMMEGKYERERKGTNAAPDLKQSAIRLRHVTELLEQWSEEGLPTLKGLLALAEQARLERIARVAGSGQPLPTPMPKPVKKRELVFRQSPAKSQPIADPSLLERSLMALFDKEGLLQYWQILRIYTHRFDVIQEGSALNILRRVRALFEDGDVSKIERHLERIGVRSELLSEVVFYLDGLSEKGTLRDRIRDRIRDRMENGLLGRVLTVFHVEFGKHPPVEDSEKYENGLTALSPRLQRTAINELKRHLGENDFTDFEKWNSIRWEEVLTAWDNICKKYRDFEKMLTSAYEQKFSKVLDKKEWLGISVQILDDESLAASKTTQDDIAERILGLMTEKQKGRYEGSESLESRVQQALSLSTVREWRKSTIDTIAAKLSRLSPELQTAMIGGIADICKESSNDRKFLWARIVRWVDKSVLYYNEAMDRVDRLLAHVAIDDKDKEKYKAELASEFCRRTKALTNLKGKVRGNSTAVLASHLLWKRLSEKERRRTDVPAFFRVMYSIDDPAWGEIVEGVSVPGADRAPRPIRDQVDAVTKRVLAGHLCDILDRFDGYPGLKEVKEDYPYLFLIAQLDILHELADSQIDVAPYAGNIEGAVLKYVKKGKVENGLPPSITRKIVEHLAVKIIVQKAHPKAWPTLVYNRIRYLNEANRILLEEYDVFDRTRLAVLEELFDVTGKVKLLRGKIKKMLEGKR